MSNSILCAVDISHGSDDVDVLKTAARLAEMDDAQLDIITILPDFGMSVVSGYFEEGYHEKVLAKAKTDLDEFVESALTVEQNAKVRHVISFGKTYEEILKTAKAANTSLIVVGAHKADLKDFLLGPNAARVVRHATCSVYVVR